MPNGRHDFDEKVRPGLDQFFAPVAECLERFAADHNLLLTRYWHQEPCWDYMFRHPVAGVGRIMIHQTDDNRLSVQGLWWVDRYDEFARYLRRPTPCVVECDPRALAPVLAAEFEKVLGWQEGNWDDIATGYEESWKCSSKEDFESTLAYYPVPRVP